MTSLVIRHLTGKHDQKKHGRKSDVDLSSRAPISVDAIIALDAFESLQRDTVGRQDSAKRKINTIAARSGLDRSVVKLWIKEWDHAATGTIMSNSLQETAAEMFGIKPRTSKTGVEYELDSRMGHRPAGVNYMIRKLEGSLALTDFPLERDVDSKIVKQAEVAAEEMRRRFLYAVYDETQEVLSNAGIEEMTVYRGISKSLQDGKVVRTKHPALSSWSACRSLAVGFALDGGGDYLSTIVPASRVFSLSFTGLGVDDEYEVVVLGGSITAKGIKARWSIKKSQMSNVIRIKHLVGRHDQKKHGRSTVFEKMLVFHGTTESFLSLIRQKGLLSRKQQGSSEEGNYTDTDFAVLDAIDDSDLADQIYATTDMHAAKGYAVGVRSMHKDAEGILLVIELPEGLTVRRDPYDRRGMMIQGHIPSEWIKGYHKVTGNNAGVAKIGKFEEFKSRINRFLYVPIAIMPIQEKHLAGKHDQQTHGRLRSQRNSIDSIDSADIYSRLADVAGYLEDEYFSVHKITELAEKCNLPEEVIAKWLNKWNESATRNVVSDSLQQTASEVFGIKMSKEQIKRKEENDITAYKEGFWAAGVAYAYRQLTEDGWISDISMSSNMKIKQDVLAKAEIMAKEYRKTFVKVVYADTQRLLASANIKEIPLYRGIHMSVYNTINKEVYVNENVLSSWSTDPLVADTFEELTLTAFLPATRIFSMSLTGLGNEREKEFVVLGGKVRAQISERSTTSKLKTSRLEE